MSRARWIVALVVALLAAAAGWRLSSGDGGGGAARPGAASSEPESRAVADLLEDPSERVPAELEGRADSAPSRASVSAADEGASTDGPPTSPYAGPFFGRVVNAATEEPLSGLSISPDELGQDGDPVTTDADGRFDVGAPVAGWVRRLTLRDPHNRTHVRDVPLDELEWIDASSGWLVRVSIGPTFRFRVAGFDPEAVRVRLVEESPGSAPIEHPWLRPRDLTSLPWIRYDNPLPASPPEARWFLEAIDHHARATGRDEVTPALGVCPDTAYLEPQDALSTVHGRVLFADGTPAPERLVELTPLRALAGQRDLMYGGRFMTGRDGRYDIAGVERGDFHLSVDAYAGGASVVLALAVDDEEVEAPDVYLPFDADAKSISGELVGRDALLRFGAVLHLRGIDEPRIQRSLIVSPPEVEPYDPRRRGPFDRSEFAFDELPDGRYLLELEPVGGASWTPLAQEVVAGRDDVEFHCEPAGDGTWWAAIDPRDALTDAPLDACRIQAAVGDYWSDQSRHAQRLHPFTSVEDGGSLRALVHAPGFVPRVVTERDFVQDPDDETLRVARVPLHQGWGAWLVVRDDQEQWARLRGGGLATAVDAEESPPVAGAEVWADGVLVGTTGVNGELRFDLAAPPERVEVRAEGWHTLGSRRFEDGRIGNDDRRVTVWMRRL